MLSHAGKEAKEVYKTLQWTEEGDNQKFNKVIEAFRRYCSPRKHILYERYTFWTLQQQKEESVDAYLTQIKLKLDMCEYAAEVRQELTRDKFIFGLTNDRLKERLLREENLDLATAVGQAQRAESSKRQIREMSTRSEVNAVERSRSQPPPAAPVQCGNCGRRHKPKQCPAYGQECLVCHKLNHFSRVCRSRPIASQGNNLPASTRRCSSTASPNIHEIEQSNTVSDHTAEESQDLFIESLQVNGLTKSPAWFADLDTSGGQLHVKLDTGAEVSVLPYKIYKDLQPQPTLNSTGMTLTAYRGTPI